MLKKINKKGFSLIEMLAVVVVIIILSLIITPIVTKVIQNNRQKIYDSQINIIISAAKTWGAEHIGNLPNANEEGIYISLGELKSGGYIKEIVTNPKKNDEAFSDTCRVYITNKNGIINYEFIEGE